MRRPLCVLEVPRGVRMGGSCGLTFELSRARQESARPALQMMLCTVALAWCFAVGARLE